MPYILHIETATQVCSVTVARDGQLIFEREDVNGPSHAVLLGAFVAEAVKELRVNNITPDAVAVSCGPGSYTGLRIGVSEAKGLCYGFNIPLIAIDTLKIMAKGMLAKTDIEDNTLLCPMIDARRMEVYDALYNKELEMVKPISADIIDENSFAGLLKDYRILFFGNGADKCRDVLKSENAVFVESIYPRAADMSALAEEAYCNSDFVDTAYFEPFYLKEFVATVPKNKVLF